MADEYISREAAYDTLTEYYHHSTDTQHGALREALSRVPAADVAPVVRCINCIRLTEGTCPVPLLKSDESFCSWGRDMREVQDG